MHATSSLGLALMVLAVGGCGGGSDGEPLRSCRTHATAYVASGGDLAAELPVTCRFDRQTLERTCSSAAAVTPSTQTVRYAGLADFVDEARVVARTRATAVVLQGTPLAAGIAPYLYATNVDTSFSYDEQGRIVNLGFTSWDAQGRPLTRAPTGICTGDGGDQWSYDDQARTATRSFNTRTLTPGPVPGVVPCIQASESFGFDTAGNVVAYGRNGGLQYKVQSSEQVCTN